MQDVMELVAYIAVNLVDNPDDVRIEKAAEGDEEVYRLHVHPDDLGKVIGKGGQTARAVHTLVQAFGDRNGRRLAFEIVDEQ